MDGDGGFGSEWDGMEWRRRRVRERGGGRTMYPGEHGVFSSAYFFWFVCFLYRWMDGWVR